MAISNIGVTFHFTIHGVCTVIVAFGFNVFISDFVIVALLKYEFIVIGEFNSTVTNHGAFIEGVNF